MPPSSPLQLARFFCPRTPVPSLFLGAPSFGAMVSVGGGLPLVMSKIAELILDFLANYQQDRHISWIFSKRPGFFQNEWTIYQVFSALTAFELFGAEERSTLHNPSMPGSCLKVDFPMGFFGCLGSMLTSRGRLKTPVRQSQGAFWMVLVSAVTPTAHISSVSVLNIMFYKWVCLKIVYP